MSPKTGAGSISRAMFGQQAYRCGSRIQRRYATHAHPTSGLSETYDSVVVGSGCSGLTAANVMAKLGLRVLVVEKTRYFGGTTAYSGGGAWIPANKYQPVLGIKDSIANATAYLQGVMGDLYEPEAKRIQAFLKSGPEMIEWMEANTSVKFKAMPLPDYHLGVKGATVGRAVYTEQFNGRLLRNRIKDIRYPLQGYSAFGSMQADFSQWEILTNPFKSVRNLIFTTKQLVDFGLDLMRFGKGASMANGNALVGRLVYSLQQQGVDMRYNTPATRLIYEGGRVAGIAVQQSGKEVIIGVRRGVVLASGGFARSEEARKYIPHEWTVVPRGNTGDGKRMAQEVSASFAQPNADNAIFAPVSILKPKTGPARRYPHFAMDRSKPGAIIVGPDGRRFANESEPYQEFVGKMHKMKMDRAWFIADRRFLRKYGMGMALPWPYPISRILRQGYLIQAGTIEDLAEAIKVPKEALKQTVANMNQYAQTGHDPEFGRGDNIYDQFYGDPHHKPNTNLGPCSKGPFYALALYPGNVSSMVGIETDENAAALDSQGKVVKGLYVVGCDQNSIVRGTYPAGGCSIGPGMTFGFRAGMHIATVTL